MEIPDGAAHYGRRSASLPLFVLAYFYLQAARRSGPLRPVWEKLSNPWSPDAWQERLGWVDPITLAVKDGIAVHKSGQPGVHHLRSRGVADGRPGVMVVRANDRPAESFCAGHGE